MGMAREGTFQIGSSKTAKGNPFYWAQISATNCDRQLLDRCETIAGGYVTGPIGRRLVGLARPAFRWELKAKNIDAALPNFLPHLVGKRHQAEIIRNFRSGIDVGAKAGCLGRAQLSRETTTLRERYKLAIHALNHRGSAPPNPKHIEALRGLNPDYVALHELRRTTIGMPL